MNSSFIFDEQGFNVDITFFLTVLEDLQYKLTKSHEKEAETRELYFSQQTRISELIEHLNSVTQEKKQLLAELTHEKSHAKNIEEIRVK